MAASNQATVTVQSDVVLPTKAPTFSPLSRILPPGLGLLTVITKHQLALARASKVGVGYHEAVRSFWGDTKSPTNDKSP
jgi:hypothetical protein